MLVDDTQLTALAKAVIAANATYLTPDADPNSAYGKSVAKMKELLRQVMAYITGNAEVSTALDVAAGAPDLTVLVAGAPVPVLGASIAGQASAGASGTVA